LDPVLERIEQQRCQKDGNNQVRRRSAGNARADQHRGHSHGHEVCGGNRGRSQGIDHAALEDNVNIHQPIADDGIAEGQRQEHQRQHADLGGRRGCFSPQELEHVKQKGHDGQNGAASYPLHLLAHDRDAGTLVAIPQDRGRGDEICGQIRHLQAVKIPAQYFAGGQMLPGKDLQPEKQGSGGVHHHQQPGVVADEFPMFGKGQGKMQEERRL